MKVTKYGVILLAAGPKGERAPAGGGGARLAGGSSALRFVCDGRGGGGRGLAGRLVEQVAPRVHSDADEGRKTTISGTV